MQRILPALILTIAAGSAARAFDAPRETPPLIRAIRDGDQAAIASKIKNIDERDSRGNTPLHWAALSGDESLVKRLLDAGADAKAKNNAGSTPLHYGTGSAAVVKLLLASGADPNAVSASGYAPIHSAAGRAGSAPTIRLLLDAGAKVDAVGTTFFGPFTALGLASFAENEDAVALLLERGADAKSPVGARALAAAADAGSVRITKALIAKGTNLNEADGFSGHALNHAFMGGFMDLGVTLLEAGSDTTIRSGAGEKVPPMVFSAYSEDGDATAAKALLAKGVDINAVTSDGHTSLDWALKRGETPVTRFLRENGGVVGRPPRVRSVPRNEIPGDEAARASVVREAVQQSIDLLQKSSDGFLANKFVKSSHGGVGCVSCHQQTLPAVAFGRARDKGLRVNEASIRRQVNAQIASWKPGIDEAYELRVPQPDAPYNLGYGLLGLSSLGHTPDFLTDAMVWYLAHSQLPDGSFSQFGLRPPLEDGRVVGTALVVRALRLYPQPIKSVNVDSVVAKAKRWLTDFKPKHPNHRIHRLLGLGWAGASPDELKDTVKEIIDAQRGDGGWATLDTLGSDAWATGLTLFALHEVGGIKPKDPTYRKGADFLLRTRFPDGSWWVASRTWPFQPHFDSGFPHGKDQWISASATAWAAVALLNEIEAEPTPNAKQPLEIRSSLMVRGSAPQSNVATVIDESNTRPVFDTQIRPILERSCIGCHGGEKPRGALDLTSRESMLKGGQSGEPALIPGNADDSPLMRFVRGQVEDLEMPPLDRRSKYPALSADEIAKLRDWIADGAPSPKRASTPAKSK